MYVNLTSPTWLFSLRSGEELPIEECNLLPVAYKDVVDAQRALWRTISLIEHKEEGWGKELLTATIRSYHSKIEVELSKICYGIFVLLDSNPVPFAPSIPRSSIWRWRVTTTGSCHLFICDTPVWRSNTFIYVLLFWWKIWSLYEVVGCDMIEFLDLSSILENCEGFSPFPYVVLCTAGFVLWPSIMVYGTIVSYLY